MDYFSVIVNPDKVQRNHLRQVLSTIGKVDFKEFDNEEEATKWLINDGRQVDFIFLSWTLSKQNRALLETLRTLEVSKEALIFLIASTEDYEWIKAIFGLGAQVDNILVKPFRPKALKERLDAVLKEHKIDKSCVLLVEDDSAARDILKKYLTSFGFNKVLEAGDGDEGFKLLEKHADDIALIVSDWEMPNTNGMQLLRKIRNTPKYASKHFIMVTSQTSIEEIKTIQAAEVGVDGYLNKPFDLKTFKGKMDEIFKQLESKRQAERYLLQGRTLIAQGNPFKAIETLTEGVGQLPTSSALHEALGDACCAVESKQNKEHALKQGAEAYETALRLNPLKTSLVMKCFEVHTVLGNRNDCIRILKDHLQKLGLNDDLRTRLGKIYLQNGFYLAAEKELKRALNVNPANTEAQSLYQIVLSLKEEAEKKNAA
ncbi:MAG: response regulator [Bdellovibrionales bacterium]|nr:response regulator [Bdellovibrionales bacterium]